MRGSTLAFGLICVYPLACIPSLAVTAVPSVRLVQCAYVLAWVGWLMLSWDVARRRRAPTLGEPNAAADSPRVAPRLRHILWTALACRLILLPLPASDDVYRYLWEGRVARAGFNPYLLAPNAEPLVTLRDSHWTRINHPEHAAIYGPTAEALFWLIPDWPHPVVIKLLVLVADVATVLVLLRWLRRRGDDPRGVAVYALSPLSLSAFAHEAHIDAWMVLGLTWLLCVMDRPRARRIGAGAALASGLALGLAIGVKWVPIVLVPWWLAQLAGRPRAIRDLAALLAGWMGLFAIVVLPALLYVDAGWSLVGPLRYFAANYHALDTTRRVLELSFGAAQADSIALAVVALLAIGSAVSRASAPAAILWTLGGLILFLPTIHRWYLTWLLPALCVRRSWPWLLLVGTMVFAYEGDQLRQATGQWAMPSWVGWWVFTPFYAALLLSGLLAAGPRQVVSRFWRAPGTRPPFGGGRDSQKIGDHRVRDQKAPSRQADGGVDLEQS